MKKLMPALYAVLLLLCIYFTFFFSFHIQDKQPEVVKFSIENTPGSFRFKAAYPPRLTTAITAYLDSCTNQLAKRHPALRIQISEGHLTVKADKQANLTNKMVSIKSLCQDIMDYFIQY